MVNFAWLKVNLKIYFNLLSSYKLFFGQKKQPRCERAITQIGFYCDKTELFQLTVCF
jgi:hypothetical protein